MSLRFFRKKAGDKESAETDIDITKQEEKKPARRRTSRARANSESKTEKKIPAASSASESEPTTEKKTPAASSASESEATTEKKTPARRSRTPRSAPAAQTPSAATPSSPASSSTTAKSSNGRRRGRRGGAGRRPAGAKAEETAVDKKASDFEQGTIEAILQDLAAQQVSTLKGLQSSLSSIENRLANGAGGRSSALADRPRIGIFVDVPNIMYAAERERVTLDYGKVLDYIIGGRELVRASAYSPISDDPDEELDTQKFVQPFMDLGYRIVTKPLKRYANGTIKANFDVELAIDVLTMADRLDIVVLLSGDGDFRRLVEIVASKGVRVEVVAFGPSTAGELRTVADVYTDLNDHLVELRVKA